MKAINTHPGSANNMAVEVLRLLIQKCNSISVSLITTADFTQAHVKNNKEKCKSLVKTLRQFTFTE